MEKKHECCTPEGQVPRYVDCVGCDKKPIEGATLSYAQAQKDSFNIMEKKQSSVDWLEWQINLGLSERGLISAFKEAKAMHKEEVVKAFDEGQECEYQVHINSAPKYDSETYYNETFGVEDEN